MEVLGLVLFFGCIAVLGLVFRSKTNGTDPGRSRDRPEKGSRHKGPWANVSATGSLSSAQRPKGVHVPVHVPESQIMSGRCYVEDGDTIYIKGKSIRLFGIDAPEMNHPYGRNAKWAMVKLCKGQKVRAEVVATDHFGRLVAKCYLPDGRDLSAELVKQGLAIDWRKFSGGTYRQFETPDARKKLWRAVARQQGRQVH